MSSANCCYLTCIQISQEAGQVVWYSHLFKNFPLFVVIHKVKGFGIVNKAEIDVFLELSFFFDDPKDVGNLISGSSAFCKTSLNIWNFREKKIFNTITSFFLSGCSGSSLLCTDFLQFRCIWASHCSGFSCCRALALRCSGFCSCGEL